METESWFESVKVLHVNAVGPEYPTLCFTQNNRFWYRKEAKLENKIGRSLITRNMFCFRWMNHQIVYAVFI